MEALVRKQLRRHTAAGERNTQERAIRGLLRRGSSGSLRGRGAVLEDVGLCLLVGWFKRF